MMTELFAVILIAIGATKLAALLGMQIVGDFREAARQASIKRLHAQKRRYTPTVSAVIFTDNSSVSVIQDIDALRASNYTLKEIIIIADPKAPITKEINHYRRVEKVAKLVSVRHHAVGNRFKILGAKPKGQLLLLLDGTSLPTPSAVGMGIVPFRDKSVATVMPYAVPVVTTSLFSGIRAARHVVSLHFRRSRAPKQSDIYGALLMRTPTYSRIVKKHPVTRTLGDFAELAKDEGNQARLVRQADATVVAGSVRFAPIFSFGALLWWAIDVLAIWAVLYYFGRYEGAAVLMFAALFTWILAVIAVVVAKGLRVTDKLNLALLAPFSYVLTQLLAPVWWLVGYIRSIKQR